jgi:hypothetical protein
MHDDKHVPRKRIKGWHRHAVAAVTTDDGPEPLKAFARTLIEAGGSSADTVNRWLANKTA